MLGKLAYSFAFSVRCDSAPHTSQDHIHSDICGNVGNAVDTAGYNLE